eukprot:TRINITY_DN8618_c0_g1_i1.p1 TRINITY_DN8618_c0_g1~~TRINITY_DN8618_c0_g1_i1.p1  ORF type:complete len:519 (+),score=213.49 TRINITY_DN8618_c0_g1_i1:121-1677(+)
MESESERSDGAQTSTSIQFDEATAALDIRTCGLGHVFGHLLPTRHDFAWCKGRRIPRRPTRPKEVSFIRWVRVALVVTTIACMSTPVMYYIVVADGSHDGVNRTDALGPPAVQACLVLWLLCCRVLIYRLGKEQTFVRRIAQQQQQQQCGGASDSQYDAHLLNLQSSDMVDLHMLLEPKLTCPGDGSQLEDARSIVRHIAYRGIQLSKSTPLFKGVPVLPEAQNFFKSAVTGLVLAVLQATLIRTAFDGSKDLTKTLAVACYWTSTAHFTLALFILYSLLVLIVLNFRQQALMVARLSDMMVRQRALKCDLPYFVLNSTRNLKTWYAVRQFLVAHVTRKNALSVLIEPTFAMLILAIGGSSLTLVVRHLFESRDIDLFSGACLTLLATSLIFVMTIAYYGVEIGSLFDSHCDVLANIQYEATKKWNSLIEELESTPPLSRSEATAQQVHVMWSIRRYAMDLLDICKVDKHHPNVFGTSFASMKWWLVIGLLTLNSVIVFALRYSEPTPYPAPWNSTDL